MPYTVQAKLVEKKQLSQDIYLFTVEAPNIAKEAKAGQFIEIRVTDGLDPFLRRPISIYSIEKERGTISFVFQIKGKGTQILAQKKEQEEIDIIGPLGYGTFELENYKNIAILGGGIGTFPLYELAKNAKEQQRNVFIYFGFRSKELVVLEEEFRNVCDQYILTTDDGSYREKGYAIDFLKEDYKNGKIDAIFACGPLPMLKALRTFAIQKNIPCQISLEEKMGCGLGACLGCAVKTAKEETTYVHVCKMGPVFEAKEVEI